MAAKTAVNVTIAGDAGDAVRAFDEVGGAAQKAGKKFDEVEGSAGRFSRGMEGAETAGDRAERGFRGLNDVLGVAAESFGLPLGPMGQMLPMVTQLGGGLADLAPELARLPGLQQAAAAAAKVQAGAQMALNAVMNANPLLLVVTAIALLVGAFITAYTTSETFRDIVNGAFGAVLGVIQGVWNWVSANWPLLLAILTGPIGLAVLAITTHFDDIKGLATGAKDWIVDRFNDLVGFVGGLPGRMTSAVSGLFDEAKELATDAYNWVTGKLDDMVGWVRGMPSKITSAASGLFDGLIAAAKAGLNGAIDAINGFIGAVNSIHISAHIPGWVPGVGGKGFDLGFSIPTIPHLAQGGIVTAPTLALIGEAGPEAVVPLSRGGMGNTYNITVNSLDARTAAKAVIDAINEYERRNGPRFARA